MKSLVSTITLMVVVTLTACAQNAGDAKADATKSNDPYKLFQVVGSAEYNFGKIDSDQTVEHTYVFKNSSNEMITIENARASCGCTAAVISEKDIKPGAEAKIQVKFTPPKGTRGQVTKSVSVFLKGESQPHTVLRFTADVKSDLDIQPSYLQFNGAVVGQPVVGKAVVKNVSPADVNITIPAPNMTLYVDTTKAGSPNPGGSVPEQLTDVRITPTEFTLKPGETMEVSVTVVPPKKGQINGQFRLKTAKNEALVSVFGLVRPKN